MNSLQITTLPTVTAQAQSLDLSAPVDGINGPLVAYLGGLAPGASRGSMRSTLNQVAKLAGFDSADSLPWHAMRSAHTGALRSLLADRYSPAGANKSLAAVRGVLKAAWRLNMIETDEYLRAIDLDRVRGSSLPAGRALDRGEATALFAACANDNAPAGARDAAAFALMYGAGLRRAEAAALQVSDYDAATGELRVRGKGNKERIVYANNGGADALTVWLAYRGDHAGALLQPVRKDGDIDRSKGITSQALLYRLKLRARQAQIKECSPHDLRRSFVSELLDAGADISAVQRLAGHSSTDTTARYDRRGERAARKASDMLHVPYTLPAHAGIDLAPSRPGRPTARFPRTRGDRPIGSHTVVPENA